MQAQGLLQAMGGNAEVLAATLRSQRVLLAAHGPYTAAGVAETLGVSVGCVSKDFSSFDGEALSMHPSWCPPCTGGTEEGAPSERYWEPQCAAHWHVTGQLSM
jgi:hypothetical protein